MRAIWLGGYMRNIDWPAAWIWTALAVAVILGITTWTMWAPGPGPQAHVGRR